MKIMISGSMAFAKEMVETKEKLEKMGYEVGLPFETEVHLEKPEFVDDLSGNLQYCIDKDVIWKSFDYIAHADAVLVLNHPRKGVSGYIGTSTLMEIAIAYYFHKKIYLLNPIPHFDEVRWAHEITIMQPVILYGDLKKIM
jgi:hypothetical protein